MPTVNGDERCFEKKGDANLIQSNLLVAIRTETRSHPTKM